ncbi:hypothetical protein JCM10450v2_005446 [Rhodotorula kratochvilovae]
MDTVKRKKPPACDRCKSKRVLCHPNPKGCPRCVEKGVEPQRKSRDSTEAPTTVDAPAPQLSVNLSAPPPVPSTSQVPYTPLSLVSYAAPAGALTPALVKHLFFCHQQLPTIDHPLIRTITIRDTLDALSWDVNLLPIQQRAYVYAVCAHAASISFSRLVVGEALAGASWQDVQSAGADLRAYGRARKAVCEALKSQARRIAREADVLVEPTRENAATCVLLNALDDTGASQVQPKSRPWLAACFSHIRSLPELWPESSARLETMLWTGWFICDCISKMAVSSPVTRADELLFVGADEPDLIEYDKALQETLKQPLDRNMWPDLKPFGLLLMSFARELTEQLLGPHAVRAPLNEQAVFRVFQKLEHLRSIARFYTEIVDRIGEPTPQLHFDRALTPTCRYTRGAALRAIRSFGTSTWAVLVFPLYVELRRRSRLNHEHRAASFDSANTGTRAAAHRLETYVAQSREMVRAALDFLVDGLQRTQALVTWTHVRSSLLPEYAALLLEELAAGTFVLDERIATATEALAGGLKLVGYVHANATNDALIERLEGCAASYRVTVPPMQLCELANIGAADVLSALASEPVVPAATAQLPLHPPTAEVYAPALAQTSFTTFPAATPESHIPVATVGLGEGVYDAVFAPLEDGGGQGEFPGWAW